MDTGQIERHMERIEADGYTIVEDAGLSSGPSKASLGHVRGKSIALSDLSTEEAPPPRTISGMDELDRVLGGGLVPASAILVGGDPGIGKSTLLLQAAAQFANRGLKTIYVSGEEASAQVRMRATRLGLEKAPVKLAAETSLRDIGSDLTTFAEQFMARSTCLVEQLPTMTDICFCQHLGPVRSLQLFDPRNLIST